MQNFVPENKVSYFCRHESYHFLPVSRFNEVLIFSRNMLVHVSEAITRFEYFCPGFVQERVPTVPLLFQIQLDELYRSVQSDFLQLKL